MSFKRRLDEDAFQPTFKKTKTYSDRNPNCAVGVIQKIRLENFMCHSKLTLEPNANMNFITGANGAGKSSILQALVLGLCGDSKSTKRYSKVSNFVQKGATKAVIEITLNNDGEDSFKPEVYGRSIIFERSIRDNGQSIVRLKDVNGNVKEERKRAKEEGKRALDMFRIQVDNPVIVLQQDEAKEMLKVESPDKLYQFFIKATLIKQVIEQYKAGHDDIELLVRKEKRLRIDVKEKQQKLIDMRTIIDDAKERDVEWKRLSSELVWAHVKDIGEKVQDIQKEFMKKQSQLSGPYEKLVSLKHEAQSLHDQIIENDTKNEEEKNKFSGQEEELETLNQQINSFKLEGKKSRAELKTCDTATSKTKTEIRQLEDQLNNLRGKSVEEMEQLEKERMRQVCILKQSIDEATKAIEVETERRNEITTEEQNLVREAEQLDHKNKEFKSEVEEVNRQINEITAMENRLGNRGLAVYGPDYAKVEAEILSHQNATRDLQFERKPIGPVGHYVKLKAPAVPGSDLAKLVETVLSPLLRSYLCHSDKDRKMLYIIFNNVFGPRAKPRIIVSKFLPTLHSSLQKFARADVATTLMDLLEIQEVAVFNCLVDQLSIEGVAVCQTQDEAKRITTRRENVPRNLQHAITVDFNKFYPPKDSSSYRSYYIEQNARGLLTGSTAEALNQKHILLEENKSKLKENENEKSKVKRQKDEISIKKVSINKNIRDLGTKRVTYNAKLEDAMIKPENDISQKLAESIAAKKKYINELEVTREEILSQRAAKELESTTIEETRDIKAREVIQLKAKWCTFDIEFSKTNALYTKKKKEIANQEKVVKKIEVDQQNLERKRKATLLEHEKARKLALETTDGREIEPSESKEKLSAKLALRRKDKENSSSISTTDLEKLEDDYIKLRRVYEPLRRNYENAKMTVDSLMELKETRRESVLDMRKRVVNMVRRKFNHLTGEIAKDIGCRIFLKINSTKKELHFEFKSLSGNLLKTDVASLSGGEKSYAQMALIMSLWEHMQPPFRCLDEWDVFLDQVNREKIQKKLYKFGLSQNEKQFMFLSPQGSSTYSDITPEEKHKVAIIEVKKS